LIGGHRLASTLVSFPILREYEWFKVRRKSLLSELSGCLYRFTLCTSPVLSPPLNGGGSLDPAAPIIYSMRDPLNFLELFEPSRALRENSTSKYLSLRNRNDYWWNAILCNNALSCFFFKLHIAVCVLISNPDIKLFKKRSFRKRTREPRRERGITCIAGLVFMFPFLFRELLFFFCISLAVFLFHL